jgi:hypothetical protein
MGIEMTVYEQIKAVLSEERSEAMDANEVFERCKGLNDRNEVSIALSYMYRVHKSVEREENDIKSGTRFRYWKKPTTASATVKTDPVEEIVTKASEPAMEVPAFLKNETFISTEPYIVKVAAPAETLQEPTKEENAQLAPAPYQLTLNIAAAADLLLSTLPEYSEIRIVRESANNTRISLSLDDGNHLLVNLHPVDIQISLDAFATLQRYKDQQ